jgi:hypothetical protein
VIADEDEGDADLFRKEEDAGVEVAANLREVPMKLLEASWSPRISRDPSS